MRIPQLCLFQFLFPAISALTDDDSSSTRCARISSFVYDRVFEFYCCVSAGKH